MSYGNDMWAAALFRVSSTAVNYLLHTYHRLDAVNLCGEKGEPWKGSLWREEGCILA
jgi:hypothetical protein